MTITTEFHRAAKLIRIKYENAEEEEALLKALSTPSHVINIGGTDNR